MSRVTSQCLGTRKNTLIGEAVIIMSNTHHLLKKKKYTAEIVSVPD